MRQTTNVLAVTLLVFIFAQIQSEEIVCIFKVEHETMKKDKISGYMQIGNTAANSFSKDRKGCFLNSADYEKILINEQHRETLKGKFSYKVH